MTATGLNFKLIIDDMPNENDYFYDNEFDDTKTDVNIKWTTHEGYISMSNSIVNDAKSRIDTKSKKMSEASGFSAIEDDYIKDEVKTEEDDFKAPHNLNDVSVDGSNFSIKTEQDLA